MACRNRAWYETQLFTKKEYPLSASIGEKLEKGRKIISASNENTTLKTEYFEGFDLMLIRVESWKKLVDTESEWLPKTPSVSILKTN